AQPQAWGMNRTPLWARPARSGIWASSLETAPSFMSLAPELLFYGPRRLTVLHKFASRRMLACRARGTLRRVAEPRLIDPGAGGLDDLRHLGEVLPQQGVERVHAEGLRLDPLLRQPLQDHRLAQQLFHRRVDALDYRPRGRRGREQPEPGIKHISWDAALGNGGKLHELRAVASGGGEHAHALVLDEGQRADIGRDHGVRTPGEHLVDRLACRPERHVDQLDAGEAGKVGHRQVRGAAVARARVVELP